MSRPDLSPDDVEALLAAHETREKARQVLARHTLPASSDREAVGGMGAIAVIVAAIAILTLGALAHLISKYGPAILASALRLLNT